MTPDQITAEFLRIERAAMKTPQGADHEAILRTVAAKTERPVSEVRAIILDNAFTEPN